MKLTDLAIGRWGDILPALGISRSHLTGKHGPCPICGGSDRFRWDNKGGSGSYFCSQCGAGDAVTLVQKATNRTYGEIADEVKAMIAEGSTTIRLPQAVDEAKQRQAMRSLWELSSVPIEGSMAYRYMINRCGRQRYSRSIRDNDSVWNPITQQRHPAMVSKILGHDDAPVNLHITYLDRDARKIATEPSKRVMAGKLPDGCAIRLGSATTVMGIAEGIETAWAASILYDMPVWAAINSNMLSKWVPPRESKEIYVFSDNDENYTGQSKAYHLANRLVMAFQRKVEVIVPDVVGWDFDDVLRKKAQ